MKTDFDIANRYVCLPAVFRSDFNNFAPIATNQAWSLFFTAGRNDLLLGSNPELGQLFNNLLKAIVVSFIVGVFIFRSF
ncbi:MAG: hypothetical protein KME06_12890 [Kastovskya adunca ATA6-11-RM4]|nr:hypothetical protein [Kastovskya adunca ATA6-11-RM4]